MARSNATANSSSGNPKRSAGKGRPTPNRSLDRNEAIRRANRNATLQWWAIGLAVVVAVVLIAVFGGDGSGIGTGGHGG